MKLDYSCIDTASNYCPCYLAETGDCIVCSVLRGSNNCDCRWPKICIYQEFLWNGRKKANMRNFIQAKIIEKKIYSENLFTLTIKLPQDIQAINFGQAGTFVFIKPQDSPNFYEVPICVMDIDEENNLMFFAIQVLGPKTKNLLNENEKIVLRGPYYNGILGLKYIKSSISKNCMLIGRGIGQASLVMVAKTLNRGNNRIIAMLNPGAVMFNISEEILKKYGFLVEPYEEESLRDLILKGNFDLIFSAGSNSQHKFIFDLIRKNCLDIKLAISNNFQICCGEGVCGSCALNLDGEMVRFCKVQLDAERALEEGLL